MNPITIRGRNAPLVWMREETQDEDLIRGISQLLSAGAKGILVFACSDNNHTASGLNSFLQSCPVGICGGIFPGVFYGKRVLRSGFLLIGLPFSIRPITFEKLSDSLADLDCPEFWRESGMVSTRDMLVFVDAMATNCDDFTSTLYETIGGGINVMGGGAGSLAFTTEPCVISNKGLLADSAVVVSLPVPMQCSVDHGWQVMSGPYLVTEAKASEVISINYVPALELYQKIIEQTSSYRFDGNEFFSVSQNFPLGIVGINEDILVRDPLTVSESRLVCAGNVPENSMIYILRARHSQLIDAAYMAGDSLDKDEVRDLGINLVFDCISRVLYLGDKFVDELDAIQRGVGHDQVMGVFSIGEIANTTKGTISLLNKSIVVGAL